MKKEKILLLTPLKHLSKLLEMNLQNYHIEAGNRESIANISKKILYGNIDYVLMTGKINPKSNAFDGYYLFKTLVKLRLEYDKNIPKAVLLLSNRMDKNVFFYPFIVPISTLENIEKLIKDLKNVDINDKLYEHINKLPSIFSPFSILPYHR